MLCGDYVLGLTSVHQLVLRPAVACVRPARELVLGLKYGGFKTHHLVTLGF